MMKKITLGMAFLSLFLCLNAQAQVYEKGNWLFDVYYGAPNLYTATFKGFYNDPAAGYINPTATSLGPMGIKGEYLLSSKIGIGLHVNDALSKVTGTYQAYDYSTSSYQNYTFTAKSNVIRIMPTINIHLGNSSWFDPYFSFGLGYNHRSTSLSTTDPSGSQNVTIKTLVPVATRAEFGMRFFFTKHLGANVFVGLPGGALVGAGLSVKL